jgi:hypothetical protein
MLCLLGAIDMMLTVDRDQKEGVQAFFEKRKPNFRANLDDNTPLNVPWWTEVDTGRRPKAKTPAKL